MNIKQLSKYRQGVQEAQRCIAQGKDAHDLLLRSRNRWYNQGVKQVLKENTDQLIDSSVNNFEIEQEGPTQFSVNENGKHKYTIYKSTTGKWVCTCLGYKFRHKCKHIDAFAKQFNKVDEVNE